MSEIPVKKKKKKKLRIGVVFLLIIIAAYLVTGIFGIRMFNQYMEDAPELRITDLVSPEVSRLYDVNGNLVQEFGETLRENVTYDELPECLIDAFLAIEDSRYFVHHGFDTARLVKVALEYVQSGVMGAGGSTFTMQLVKNTYFTIEDGENSQIREKTISYKVQQIVLSAQLESLMNKKEIMQLYLNKLNFGKNIRGVQRASEYYFGKNVTELNVSEAALLAGIIALPNEYNPYVNLEAAGTRRDEVLYQMHNHGYINDEEYTLYASIAVEDLLAGETFITTEQFLYQSYVDAAIEEAEQLTGMDPLTTGMQIYTYLDPVIQSEIESVQKGLSGIFFSVDNMQTAMISINNQTGEIAGIGGGRYYTGVRLLNRATDAYKQPGSSMKPVLSYALAFEYLGYSLDEVLLDEPMTLLGESRVLSDATGTYQGDISIKDATAQSLNIPAVRTLQEVENTIGEEGIIAYMQNAGFSQVNEENFSLLFAIGGNEFTCSVEEAAAAHAAMINLGTYIEPHTISKVVDYQGNTYTDNAESRQIISSGSAWLSDQLMKFNVDSAESSLYINVQRDYPVYAKTGTTDWGTSGTQYGIPEGVAKDVWMIASTGQYTNAVWCGFDQVERGNEYFDVDMLLYNYCGRINSVLLDAEERTADSELLYQGVSRSEDVQDITYVYGTSPHVVSSDSTINNITSQVSVTGLNNQPMVSAEEYASAKALLKGINTLVSGQLLIVRWNTVPSPCSYYRDISLYDHFNNISMYGTCLVDNTWLYSGDYRYFADIYCDDTYVRTIEGSDGQYYGQPGDLHGEVKVCAYVTTSGGTSDQVCRSAGSIE